MGLSNQNFSLSNQSPPLPQTYVLIPATEVLGVKKPKTQTSPTLSLTPKTAFIASGIFTTLGTGCYFLYKHYSAKTQPINRGLFETMSGLFFVTFLAGITTLACNKKAVPTKTDTTPVNPIKKVESNKLLTIDFFNDSLKMISYLNDFQTPLNRNQKECLQTYTSLLLEKLSKINTKNEADIKFFFALDQVFQKVQKLEKSLALEIAKHCLSAKFNLPDNSKIETTRKNKAQESRFDRPSALIAKICLSAQLYPLDNSTIKKTRENILKSILQDPDLGIAFVINCIKKDDNNNYQWIIDEGIKHFFHKDSIEQQLEFLKECAKLNPKHLEIQKVVINTFFHLHCCDDILIDELTLKEVLNAFLEVNNDQMVRLFLITCEALYSNLYHEIFTLAYNTMKNNKESLKILNGLSRKKIIELERDESSKINDESGVKTRNIKQIRF